MTSAAMAMIMREGQRKDQLLMNKQNETMKKTSTLDPVPVAQSCESSRTTQKLPKLLIVATGIAIALSAYKFRKKVF
jgi:hypothetical protein